MLNQVFGVLFPVEGEQYVVSSQSIFKRLEVNSEEEEEEDDQGFRGKKLGGRAWG